MYQPSMVFKYFDVSTLKDNMDSCICLSSSIFGKFLDKDTCDNAREGLESKWHVRTMDLNIIQHKGLRHALKMGLNQIPLRSTIIHEVIQVVFDVFLKVC